jgi:hypothetical protein
MISKITEFLKAVSLFIGIAGAMGGIIGTIYGIRQNKEANRAENNLYTRTVQWEDERGRLVTETTELRYTLNELRNISKKDSSKMSEAEKQLLAARKEIDALRIKPRNVESVNTIGLESRGTFTTDYETKPDTVKLLKIDPIETEFISLYFKVEGDSILVDHLYKNTLNIIVDRDYGLNARGKPRFFLTRWISPKWQYSSNVVSEDPNADITSNVYIKFQKHKGKRE